MAIVKRIFQLACVLSFHTSVSGVPTSLEALLPRSATSVAISVLPTTTTAYNFTVSRQSPAADNLATGSGNGILVLPLPAVATASAGYFTITSVPPVSSADAPRTFGIEVRLRDRIWHQTNWTHVGRDRALRTLLCASIAQPPPIPPHSPRFHPSKSIVVPNRRFICLCRSTMRPRSSACERHSLATASPQPVWQT